MQHTSHIFTVKEWNSIKRGTILAYTLGNGSIIDTPRQRGYVVQKHHTQGGEMSQYFSNYQKAEKASLIW